MYLIKIKDRYYCRFVHNYNRASNLFDLKEEN